MLLSADDVVSRQAGQTTRISNRSQPQRCLNFIYPSHSILFLYALYSAARLDTESNNLTLVQLLLLCTTNGKMTPCRENTYSLKLNVYPNNAIFCSVCWLSVVYWTPCYNNQSLSFWYTRVEWQAGVQEIANRIEFQRRRKTPSQKQTTHTSTLVIRSLIILYSH